MTISATKPYLLRAIFEWAEDNGLTPQVLVDAQAEGVEVPNNHIVDGQIVLNISSSAIQLQLMDNQCLSFSARFSGVEQNIFLPIDSILAIFARENSQGIFFEDQLQEKEETEPTLQPVKGPHKAVPPTEGPDRPRGGSHLKIIK